MGVVQGVTGEGTRTAAETRTVGGTHTMEEAEVEAVTAAGTEGGATGAGREHLLQGRGVLLRTHALIRLSSCMTFDKRMMLIIFWCCSRSKDTLSRATFRLQACLLCMPVLPLSFLLVSNTDATDAASVMFMQPADSPVDTRDADCTGYPFLPYEGIFLDSLTSCALDGGCQRMRLEYDANS